MSREGATLAVQTGQLGCQRLAEEGVLRAGAQQLPGSLWHHGDLAGSTGHFTASRPEVGAFSVTLAVLDWLVLRFECDQGRSAGPSFHPLVHPAWQGPRLCGSLAPERTA